LTEPSNEEARYVIGLGLREAIEYLFPDLPSQKLALLSDRYRYHYLAQDKKISLYEGIFEIIKTLHAEKFLLAVATGKSRAGLNRAFISSGLGDYFHASRCADETFSKPHPAMLLELMEQFGVEADRTLMIGDTTHDLQMASNASVSGVGVTYGAHPRENLETLMPLACIENVMKLRSWLNTNI
jgi:phosphoglycolate phosphatase